MSGGIYNHTYDNDDNGNIIQIGSTDYGYDALNRLDKEDSGSAVTNPRLLCVCKLTKNPIKGSIVVKNTRAANIYPYLIGR